MVLWTWLIKSHCWWLNVPQIVAVIWIFQVLTHLLASISESLWRLWTLSDNWGCILSIDSKMNIAIHDLLLLLLRHSNQWRSATWFLPLRLLLRLGRSLCRYHSPCYGLNWFQNRALLWPVRLSEEMLLLIIMIWVCLGILIILMSHSSNTWKLIARWRSHSRVVVIPSTHTC